MNWSLILAVIALVSFCIGAVASLVDKNVIRALGFVGAAAGITLVNLPMAMKWEVNSYSMIVAAVLVPSTVLMVWPKKKKPTSIRK